MKQSISFITLGVTDLARSRAFYEALGWRASSGSEAAVAFFQAGSVALALFARESLAADANVAANEAGSGFAGFTLAHNVATQADVRRTLDEAVAAGAKLVRPADAADWGGYRGYFADPDGYLWEVCWNPYFPLDAEGHVQLPA